jgi:NADH:ubiquinone oxidoreductase subunit 5 (subunit L)/multisubunit Na+/H+ antiporter MnhA subunit
MYAFYFSKDLTLLGCFTSQTLDGHGVNLYYFKMVTMTVTGMTMMIMVIKKETKQMQKSNHKCSYSNPSPNMVLPSTLLSIHG